MFMYTQVIIVALGISTVRLGIRSRAAVLNDYAPVWAPFTALTSIVFYVFMRQRFKAREKTRTDGLNPEF
jgi:hypothetical protein